MCIRDRLETPLELQATPALREWNLGKLEGAKISTISAIYPQQMDAFRHNLARFQNEIFDAESVYETTKRTCDFVKSLKGKELDVYKRQPTVRPPSRLENVVPCSTAIGWIRCV